MGREDLGDAGATVAAAGLTKVGAADGETTSLPSPADVISDELSGASAGASPARVVGVRVGNRFRIDTRPDDGCRPESKSPQAKVVRPRIIRKAIK